MDTSLVLMQTWVWPHIGSQDKSSVSLFLSLSYSPFLSLCFSLCIKKRVMELWALQTWSMSVCSWQSSHKQGVKFLCWPTLHILAPLLLISLHLILCLTVSKFCCVDLISPGSQIPLLLLFPRFPPFFRSGGVVFPYLNWVSQEGFKSHFFSF